MPKGAKTKKTVTNWLKNAGVFAFTVFMAGSFLLAAPAQAQVTFPDQPNRPLIEIIFEQLQGHEAALNSVISVLNAVFGGDAIDLTEDTNGDGEEDMLDVLQQYLTNMYGDSFGTEITNTDFTDITSINQLIEQIFAVDGATGEYTNETAINNVFEENVTNLINEYYQSGAACGNGVVELGEECDDGVLDGTTCTSTCLFANAQECNGAPLGAGITKVCEVGDTRLDLCTDADGDNGIEESTCATDCSGWEASGQCVTGGIWEEGASLGDIFYDGGSVGINTDSPSEALEVAGNIAISSAEQLDQINSTGNGSVGTVFYADQSFTPGITGQLTKIGFITNSTGNSTKLRVYEGSIAPANLRSTTTVTPPGFRSTSWLDITLSTPVSVENGNTYVFTLSEPGGSSFFHVQYGLNTAYASGSGTVSHAGGSESPRDLKFRTYVIPNSGLYFADGTFQGTAATTPTASEILPSCSADEIVKWNDVAGDWECATDVEGKWQDGTGAEADEIYYDAANVGIGVADPQAALDVAGDIQGSNVKLGGGKAFLDPSAGDAGLVIQDVNSGDGLDPSVGNLYYEAGTPTRFKAGDANIGQLYNLVGESSTQTLTNKTLDAATMTGDTSFPSGSWASDGSVSIGNNVSVGGTLSVGGDILLDGELYRTNLQELDIQNNTLVLNSDWLDTTAPSENAEIRVERGSEPDQSLVWNEADDNWEFDGDVQVAGDLALSFPSNTTPVIDISHTNSSNTSTSNLSTTYQSFTPAISGQLTQIDLSLWPPNSAISPGACSVQVWKGIGNTGDPGNELLYDQPILRDDYTTVGSYSTNHWLVLDDGPPLQADVQYSFSTTCGTTHWKLNGYAGGAAGDGGDFKFRTHMIPFPGIEFADGSIQASAVKPLWSEDFDDIYYDKGDVRVENELTADSLLSESSYTKAQSVAGVLDFQELARLDQENIGTNSTTIESTHVPYQVFKAGITGKMVQVDLDLRGGGYANNVVLSCILEVIDEATSNVLNTYGFGLPNINNSGTLQTVDLSSNPTLVTAGADYRLSFGCGDPFPGAAGDSYIAYTTNTSGYPDGDGQGRPATPADLGFKTYVIPKPGILFADGTFQSTAADSSKWQDATNPDDIHYSDGLVGIGTDTPSARLNVVGDTYLEGPLTVLSTGGVSVQGGPLDVALGTFSVDPDATADSGDEFIVNSTGQVGIGADPDFDPTPGLAQLRILNDEVNVGETNWGAYIENLATNTTTNAINKNGVYIGVSGDFTGGSGAATRNYGLYVDSVTGADENYGAYFADNVGIGTDQPEYMLDVAGPISATFDASSEYVDISSGGSGTAQYIQNGRQTFYPNATGALTAVSIRFNGNSLGYAAPTCDLTIRDSAGNDLHSQSYTVPSLGSNTTIKIPLTTNVNLTQGNMYSFGFYSCSSSVNALRVNNNVPGDLTNNNGATVGDLIFQTHMIDPLAANFDGAIDVAGDIRFTGDIYKNGELLALWKGVAASDDIYYDLGNVGIGTATPDSNAKLHVMGNVMADAYLRQDGTEVGATATFLGLTTAAIYDGDEGGYAAAKEACQTNYGSTNSDAHVCTASELIYSYEQAADDLILEANLANAAANPGPSAWINGSGPSVNQGLPVNECNGWNDNTANYYGSTWDFDASAGGVALCNNTLAIACCSAVVAPPDTSDKLVFVTNANWTGNLGGVAGADAKCQAEADSAGLTGIYRAWLGSGDSIAADRFPGLEVNYKLTTGTVVADGWTTGSNPFLSGSHASAINRTATGVAPSGSSYVWTYARNNGQYPFSGGSCGNWTVSSTARSQPGLWNSVANWTSDSTSSLQCNAFGDVNSNGGHLYCIQL